MGRLDGRVAIVTGGARGLGREHVLYLAKQGAKVVVNDLGGAVDGRGRDATPARALVEEIVAAGGEAVESGHDVADWDQAGEMIALAVSTFGDLHVLVNNAGILRDKTLANMTGDDWDAVIRVHLRGHAGPSHHAAAYWRDRAKAGSEIKASVVHTSSVSGLAGNFGQANYAAAKLGIVGLSRVMAMELGKIGVRSNVVSPSARTRLTATVPGSEDQLKPPDDPQALDPFDPANVSPVVGWLAEEDCPANAQILHVIGSEVYVVSMPQIVHRLDAGGRWTAEALERQLADKLLTPLSPNEFFPVEIL